MKLMKMELNVRQLDELRAELASYKLPEKLNIVINELLVATWNISIGENLKSCDLKRSAAYKGAVCLARQAMSNIELELLDGRRESVAVQRTEGTSNADAGPPRGAAGDEGISNKDGDSHSDG